MKNDLVQMNSKEFFNAILPPFGTCVPEQFKKPRWVPGMKYWLTNEYLKEDSGNFYFEGVRLTGNLIIKEKDAIWKTWTFLDELEIWAFDGTKLTLVNKKKYEKTFQKEELVRSELAMMLSDYVYSQAKLYGQLVSPEEVEARCKEYIDLAYKDFLDSDYEIMFKKVLPMLEAKNSTNI